MITESTSRQSMPAPTHGYAWCKDSVLRLSVVVINRNKTGGKVSR